MKIFGDAIDDKIFPKEVKKFTQEEKSLIDNFINSILRDDKKSEIEKSISESYNDRRDCITESIIKIFVFKDVQFQLRFDKFYTNEKKTIKWLPSDEYSLWNLLYDGYSSHSFSSGLEEAFLKALNEDKSITGIFVKSFGNTFKLKDRDGSNPHEADVLGMRTKYQDAERGGFDLTTKCKNHIKRSTLK